jgi:hypothetical protein
MRLWRQWALFHRAEAERWAREDGIELHGARAPTSATGAETPMKRKVSFESSASLLAAQTPRSESPRGKPSADTAFDSI